MEREGGKEEKERRIVGMQKPAKSFFALKKKPSSSIVEDVRDTQKDRPSQDFDKVGIKPVVALSTPVK